jgi:hypothetical protein
VRPEEFVRALDSLPGSVASTRGEGRSAPAGAKDIFRQRIQQASDENQARQERTREIIRQKMEEIRATTDHVNDTPTQEGEQANG